MDADMDMDMCMCMCMRMCTCMCNLRMRVERHGCVGHGCGEGRLGGVGGLDRGVEDPPRGRAVRRLLEPAIEDERLGERGGGEEEVRRR